MSQIFDPVYMSLQEAEEQFVKMRESIESNKPPGDFSNQYNVLQMLLFIETFKVRH